MKKVYSVALSVAVLLGLSGGVVFAQTTSEPTTEKLEGMIQKLQQQINDLQKQVNNQGDEDESQQDDSENEDGDEDEGDDEETEDDEGVDNEDATSTTDELPEQAAAQARIARQLDQGDRGPEVRQLQKLLAANSEIYPEGLVTGYFGPLTAQAVSRLQERAGLPSVGRVGPRTLNQINSLLNEGAGQSGVIPPGLLQAPGLDGRRGDVSTSGSATSSGTTTDLTENSGGEAAKREQPQSRGQVTGPVQDPGGPPKF
jgi:hypothetical protein